jgi:hypothetical protein
LGSSSLQGSFFVLSRGFFGKQIEIEWLAAHMKGGNFLVEIIVSKETLQESEHTSERMPFSPSILTCIWLKSGTW